MAQRPIARGPLRADTRPYQAAHRGRSGAGGLVAGALVLLLLLGGGAFYYFQFMRGEPSGNAISSPYNTIPKVRAAAARLDKESCDRQAARDLVLALAEAQAHRDLARVAGDFNSRCGVLNELLPRQLAALMLLSDYKRALAVADQMVAAYRTDPQAWSWRAEANENLGNLDAAVEDYRKALNLFPQPHRIAASAWLRLVKVLEAQKKYCEALVPLRTYISFDPVNRRSPPIESTMAELTRQGNCGKDLGAGVAELPYAIGANVILANVQVNGVDGRFVVDTGASLVALTSRFARRAAIDVDRGRKVEVVTAGGTRPATQTVAAEVRLQGLVARGVQILVQEPGEPGFGADIDGLLGLSFLANYEIDMQPGKLLLQVPR